MLEDQKSQITFAEEDIRPEKLTNLQQQYIKEDRDFLLANKKHWVTVNCPACANSEMTKFGEKGGFAYQECTNCKTVYTSPRPSPELLHEFYSNSKNYEFWNRYIFPQTEQNRREHLFKPRAQRVVEYINKVNIKANTILEVGAGFGIFCEEIRKLKLFDKIIALEPTQHLAETCRQKGFEVINQPIENINEATFVDVIASFEVIEHLFSPRNFIEKCYRFLRPDGLLIITCPNIRGFDVATLKMLSTTFDHEHLNYFHPKSLSQLLQSVGFNIIEIKTPGKLDAELVKKQVDAGSINFSKQPLFNEIFVNNWDNLQEPFQTFISNNLLSSHMWIIAQKSK